ncbi:squalene hopane cyclase afumA [Aspergillus lucknowensis]|uniref:Terpene cyclase/mutase family member n=1 Tax=Aspergillus lucknowensis TaxID=176173 RepID=A0ABR4M2Y9_9EURO
MAVLTEKLQHVEDPQSNSSLESQAQAAITKATAYAWSIFSNRHWCGELESNVTVTCEHIFFLYILYQRTPPADEASQYTEWLLSQQKADGSWGIAPNHPGDVSTSAEAYLALKILGVPIDSRELSAARSFILSQGGLSKMRMFTRIFFAEFGLVSWTQIPQLPAEFIFVPASFPINIYKLASWARSNVVPLLLIAHHRPLYALPNGLHAQNPYLDELWLDPTNKSLPYGSSNPLDPLQFLFTLIDKALYYVGGLRQSPTRRFARRRCVSWILDHQEPAGDWAGIIPPMHAGIKALLLEGYSLGDDAIVRGLAAIERFTWTDQKGKRLQACISPVWDTVLMIRALRDSSVCDDEDKDDARLDEAIAWTAENQHGGAEGDWRVYQPGIPVGGFAFEYHNTWYPDIDDTAAAVLAFLAHDRTGARGVVRSETVRRAVLWIVGMQNSDGGWGAFDHENNNLFLNKIPFSDMDSLCDPSTPDVTGRVLECLGMLRGILLESSRSSRSEKQEKRLAQHHIEAEDEYMLRTITCSTQKAIPYLIRTQEQTGAWYGRWAVNYIYGTCLVLCGLQYFVNDPAYPQLRGMMATAARWLSTVQNSDGGWGESLLSYREPWRAGCGPSTPSQTAWAIMGLLAVEGYGVKSRAAKRGVEHLVRTQDDVLARGSEGDGEAEAAVWTEREFTSTGFPNHFYISYTLYRVYFPITALGRFVRLAREEQKIAAEGVKA